MTFLRPLLPPRNFTMAQAAVTPVMSALITIGMTFVLTAAAFLVFIAIRNTHLDERAPAVVPARDEAHDTLTFLHADVGLDRSRILVEMSVPGRFSYNSPAGPGSTPLPAAVLVPLGATGVLSGGDTVSFCGEAASANVLVLLQDPVTNRVVAASSFAQLAKCA
ncbi:MAG TPA: hypothetical protein VM286_07080 [Candidatus Thermoplasmatota archaeon]|nr:hypothetical protein [Candidatus Thermoplasmatota archaeon]